MPDYDVLTTTFSFITFKELSAVSKHLFLGNHTQGVEKLADFHLKKYTLNVLQMVKIQ